MGLGKFVAMDVQDGAVETTFGIVFIHMWQKAFQAVPGMEVQCGRRSEGSDQTPIGGTAGTTVPCVRDKDSSRGQSPRARTQRMRPSVRGMEEGLSICWKSNHTKSGDLSELYWSCCSGF